MQRTTRPLPSDFFFVVGWTSLLFSFYFGGSQTAWQQVSMPGSEAIGYDERGSRYLIIDILGANQSAYEKCAKIL
jgi:hypothetical protein